MKRVYVNEDRSLGCRLYEYNCAFANSGMTDMTAALQVKPLILTQGKELRLQSHFLLKIAGKRFGGVV